MDLSLVTRALCHASIDIIIGLSSLALWISVMHFEVFRGRASWEYLESLIQFLIGLTHVESSGYPLAASLKSNMEICSGLWGNQTPPAAAEIPYYWEICFHCRKCWFLVHQPAQFWLPSHPISVLSWCLDDQLLTRELLEISPPPLQHHWNLLHTQSPPHPHLPLLQGSLGYQKQS